jgi:hypothetical protein
MHSHNATCFGHIRPSSGNTFIRCLIHCTLIKYPFSYVVDVFLISFLKCGFFGISLMCYFLECAYQVSRYLISVQCIRLLIKVLPEDGLIWPKHVAL